MSGNRGKLMSGKVTEIYFLRKSGKILVNCRFCHIFSLKKISQHENFFQYSSLS